MSLWFPSASIFFSQKLRDQRSILDVKLSLKKDLDPVQVRLFLTTLHSNNGETSFKHVPKVVPQSGNRPQ